MDYFLATFVTALRTHRLLEPEQLEVVTDGFLERFPHVEALAEELVRRDWLTPYQAKQILEGRAKELVLEPYLLLRPLGRGGMGQVFKARHRHMGREVALKVVRHHCRSNPRLVERFRREIRAAARLRHDNIIHAYDANEVDGTLFLVMEYVEGVNLAQLVGDVGPLAAALASDYIRQVGLGLQHAHEQGLVHRDIKPSNLLLASKGSVVKILDLGLALLGPSWDQRGDMKDQLTPAGIAVGTIDYLAPEQALDPNRVDVRADLYSLGCTFYHLLAGRPPFPGGNQFQKWTAHKETEPRRIEALRPDLPPGLAPVVRKLMAKRPDDRYQTATAVAAALLPFCDGTESTTLIHPRSSSSTICPPSPIPSPRDEPSGPAGNGRSQDPPSRAADYIRRGKIRLKKGQLDRALDDFDAALRLDPNNAQAFYQRGYAYRKKGEGDRALADFDAAVRLDPDHPNAYISRGCVHAARGEHDRAIADYDAAIRLDPSCVRAYSNRGCSLAARGDFDRAIADYNAVLRLDPRNAPAYNDRGNAYRALGEHKMAIADYGEAIRLDPSNAGAFLNRGIAHEARGRHERAIADYGAAVRLDPLLAKAYYNRGNAHLARGDFDRAIADYDAALGLDPTNALAFNNRGRAYRKRGAPDRALADFDAALGLLPENLRAFSNRGHTHLALGRADLALADFDAMLHLDPTNALAFTGRGDALALRGEDDLAFAAFAAALRLDPKCATAYAHRAELHDRRGEHAQAEADRQAARRLDWNG